MSDYQGDAERAVKETAETIHGPDVAYRGSYPLGKTWAITFSVNRDSEVLERTNFEVISTDMQKRFPKSTDIIRFSHWAVGWIDYLIVRMLDQKGEVTKAGIATLEWQGALENYPVADEEAYSKAESDEVLESLQVNYHLSEEEASRVYRLMEFPHSDYDDADVKQAIREMRVEDVTEMGIASRDVDQILEWAEDEGLDPADSKTVELAVRELNIQHEDRETLPLLADFVGGDKHALHVSRSS